MRLWKIAAASVTAFGLIAAILVVLARWGGVLLGGFDVFYSSTVQEIVGISVFFLAGAVFYLADKVSATASAAVLRESKRSALNQDVAAEDGDVEPHSPEASAETTVDNAGDANSRALIRISHLSKVYELGPVQVHALRDASLDISAGSLTVILGPSGSGKTTLLNLLGGIDRPSSGSIQFDGIDVARLDQAHVVDYRRERVGFVFQFFNLIPSLTARENVGLAAELVPHAAEVEKILRMVGLGERMNHFPAELSGGEQQRVAIARALVKNPPLLLCDEPTGELDYTTGIKILEILKGVAHGDGRAVIVVTHNATIAEMADQVIRLRGGRIDQIVRNPEPVPPAMLRW